MRYSEEDLDAFCRPLDLLITKTQYVHGRRWEFAAKLCGIVGILLIIQTVRCEIMRQEIQWWRCQPHYQEPGHPTPVDDPAGEIKDVLRGLDAKLTSRNAS